MANLPQLEILGDLEAYQIACALGREIHFLETIDEQLAVLDNIPMERHARQLNDVSNWMRIRTSMSKRI